MSRWSALDRLRAFAVLLMVQGHAFNVLLAEGIREEPWYRFHSLVHGLTAPMFLFGAGLAFGITTFVKWENFTEWNPRVKKRFEKYFTLILIGYLMQVPGYHINGALRDDLAAREMLFRVGPLHIIAFGLIICQALPLILKDRRKYTYAVTGLGVAVLLVSPFVWSSGIAETLPLPLASWVDKSHRSLFPIFPWASFVFFGVTVAQLSVTAERVLAPARGFRWLGASAVLVLGSYGAYRMGWTGYGEHNFWGTNPLYVLFRLGWVLFFVGLFSLPKPAAGGEGWLPLLARRSLIAYVVHLLILYGTPLSPSVNHRVGRSLPLDETLVGTLAVLALTLAITWGWDRFNVKSPDGHRYMRVGLGLACAMFFIA